MGYQYDIDFVDDEFSFSNNVITDYLVFDHSNLFMCRYLNLRGSSFKFLSLD